MSPIRLTPSLSTYTRWIVIAVAVGALVLYGVFQARFLLEGPVLALAYEPETVQTSPTVSLVGTAENITSLTLNGRTIYTTDTGAFEELIVLEKGYTVVTLEAADRYGKEVTLERTFVYLPE